ncbi:hypothetical protein [Cryptosporangium phraense]|uniref:Uncharacterized protein n=1 Tax=Cryptosporangium phraense TaxID=2593070 RepID=A0A545ALP0_9ACTN|nr:hypothetical protein [Cryptosporangium phraense]TQS42233.1 hypothetical protein FL583_25170 [Cryptosporangium phraense]
MAAPDLRSLFRSGPARTAAIIVVLVVAMLLVRGATKDDDTGSASGTAQPLAPAQGAGDRPVDGDGQVTIGSTVIVPHPADDGGDLRSYRGQQAEGQQVLVLSVPADEGFWVGSGPLDRIWVQMSGPGESGFVVQSGQHVSFTGTVVEHDRGFADRVGVNMLEGAARLTSEGAHLEVPRSTVVLAG